MSDGVASAHLERIEICGGSDSIRGELSVLVKVLLCDFFDLIGHSHPGLGHDCDGRIGAIRKKLGLRREERVSFETRSWGDGNWWGSLGGSS